MVQGMRAIGRMIFSMAMVKKLGLMVLYMKESTLEVKSMVSVFIRGMMVLVMKVNGLKIRLED